MRFIQFCHKGKLPRLGVQLGNKGDVVDLNASDPLIPNTLLELLRGNNLFPEGVMYFRIVEKPSNIVRIEEVKLLPPIRNPDKIICVGLNYKSHCKENNLSIPKEPIFFSKFSSCIIGPHEAIKYPSVSSMVDWEIELAVVIGKSGYNIPLSQSLDHIFGYTIAQDISARDWQKALNGGQFLLGKSMDTFCPLGPAVVMKENIKNIYNLHMKTKVNDEIKQDSTTSDMIHRIDYLISRFSKCITLLPGDIILTGTPAGVGIARHPSEFLKPGDLLISEIEEIGTMHNIVVKDDARDYNS